MSTYKFTYFDARGRGELCRYILHAASQKFTDERFTFEQWPAHKAEAPFGQLPYLTKDGKKLAQSHSIERFLARELGLAGKDSWQQALVDQYIELIEDMFKEVVKAHFEKDEIKKKELENNLMDVTFPKFLRTFDKELTNNGGKYLVGAALTAADLAVFYGFETPLLKHPNLLDKYPKLKAHRAMVGAIPSIASYIKTRKHSDI